MLSEKSLAVDMHQTMRISEAVSQSSNFFAEGLMHLSHPIFGKLLEVSFCLYVCFFFLLCFESSQTLDLMGPIASVTAVYNADIHKFVAPGGSVFNLGIAEKFC